MRWLVLGRESEENVVCGASWGKNMDGLFDVGVEALEVCLRALWCKARGGGGRLRHATRG